MKYWGASARGLVRFICPCHGRGGPGACSHRKILKSRVLEMPFLAFWGTNFTTEGCEVPGRHDFLVDYFRG